MKAKLFCTVSGILGGAITYMFGGWSADLVTLLIMMAIDWLTGLVVAGVFKASSKTKNGNLNSSVGLKGLCKKGMMLLIVLIAYRIDLTLGTTYFRDAAIISLIVNELLSIVENAGLMGVPFPDVLVKAVDVLKDKEDKK